MAWRLRDANAARNDGFEQHGRVILLDLGIDFPTQHGSSVKHGDQHHGDYQLRVEHLLHVLNRLQQHLQTFERVVFGLNRDENLFGRAQAVEHEQAQAWPAVDEHVFVALTACFEVFGQGVAQELDAHCAVVVTGKLELCTGKVDVRRHDVEGWEHRAVLNGVGERDLAFQSVVHARLVGVVVRDAESGGGVALRVHVEDEHVEALFCVGCCQVHHGCRLTHATFLVGDGDDARVLRMRELRVLNGMELLGFRCQFRAKGLAIGEHMTQKLFSRTVVHALRGFTGIMCHDSTFRPSYRLLTFLNASDYQCAVARLRQARPLQAMRFAAAARRECCAYYRSPLSRPVV